MPTPPDDENRYASRGGIKLAAALDRFGIDVAGLVCADLGCSVGGFTDCLLQRGAARVYAVDTAYGQLAWKLRQDPRVVVMERQNALHAAPPDAPDERCDLVVVDLGWTRQKLAVPAALRWLKPASPGCTPRVITLVKPHYESDPRKMGQGGRGRHGVLSEEEAEEVTRRVVAELPALGVAVEGVMRSPVAGGKGGNTEYLALLRQADGGGASSDPEAPAND